MKAIEIRNAKANEYLMNTEDSGRFGRVFELECARYASQKTCVSKQGKAAVAVKIIINEKVRYVSAECKTNGGRVNDLLDGTNKSKFVIYRLNFTQKFKATKSAPAREEIRTIPAVIIPTALFVEMLIDCNAIKEVAHAGVVDGIAIQPSSKRMYERLVAYLENFPDMAFNPDTTYEDWMFEGLEL